MAQRRSGGRESFWSHVDQSGDCWEWTGTRDRNGYPVFRFWLDDVKVSRPAHRFLYEQDHGPQPRNVWVRRTCDNLGCVRPDHLVAATPSDVGTMAGAERVATFWSRVDRRGPEDCWEWTAYRTRQGYGATGLFGRPRPAHSVAFELATGITPPRGAHVCHHCDNPPCCNPAHLYLGDAKTNARDKHERDRFPHLAGLNGTNAKLGAGQVRAIRLLKAEGARSADLAARFGVSTGTINNVVARRSYPDVD